jgi:hypothetical protein
MIRPKPKKVGGRIVKSWEGIHLVLRQLLWLELLNLFVAAWRDAGFRPWGHLVFRKRYAG